MTTNMIMETLKEFLKQFRLTSGDKSQSFTHVSKSLPQFNSGSYNIPTSHLDTFLTNYCNAAIKELPLSIAERPGPYGPLRVDFDFKASLDKAGAKRQYDEHILKTIIGYYQAEIRAIVHPSHFTDDMLYCLVLEKKAPRIQDDEVSDGFHLHFPHFICDGSVQDKYLRDKVTLKMVENKVWAKAKFLTKVDNLIDTNMSDKVWMMYGSMNYKTTKSTPYTYNRRQKDPKTGKYDDKCSWATTPLSEQWGHAYDCNLQEVPILDLFTSEMEGRSKRVRYYLPRFLSIRGYTKSTKLIDSMEQKLALTGVVRKPRVRKIVKKRNIEDVLEDITLIKNAGFMDCLSIERADNYDTWMDVGWTLFCIGEGHEECLKMWIDYSQKSANYKPGECEDLWDKMEVRDKTIGSLRAMAKNDDPVRYSEWVTTDINNYIYKSTLEAVPTEYDVAKVAIAKYKGRFCCADSKKNIWYEFREHRWREMKDASALKLLIIEDLMMAYLQYKSNISKIQPQIATDEPNRTALLMLQEKRIIAIITKMKSINFVKNVVEFCKLKMHDPEFHKKMDENKKLMCCENGVIDLEQMIFRDGRPDDYCTLSTGRYYQEYNEDDQEVLDYDEFIHKVYPNPNLRNYYSDMISASMEGGNVNKRFIVCTGEANGGKSMTFKLMGLAFGDYMGKFPRQLLLKGNGVSSGQARPELALVRGKRIMSTQEITHMDNLDIGTVKELTGNDSFFARGMYDSGGDINPQFTMWLQCLASGTFVSLPCGISLPIETLVDNNRVIAWNNENGMITTNQTRFLDQGEKECITLTLLDGTTITCTPDHRFLNGDGEWVYARDITPGETSLKSSVYYPQYDSLESSDYKFLDYDLNVLQDKLKAMAICRMMGYYLTDGTQNRILYLSRKLDAEQVINDIELVTNKRPKIIQNISVFQVNFPDEIYTLLERLRNKMVLPKFIYDDECPSYLIKEFVAGLFGGDGIVTASMKDQSYNFGKMSLISSKTDEHTQSLTDEFAKLSEVLRIKLNIDSYIRKPKKYEDGKNKVLLTLKGIKNVLTFIETIGVRYCCHKSFRLTAIRGYYRYKSFITGQNDEIVARVLTHSPINRSLENYMKLTGLEEFCNDGKKLSQVLPCFIMPVVGKQSAGIKHVYDLTVTEPYSNFLANTVVSHNCNSPPNFPGSDEATWSRTRILDCESKFVISSDLDKYPVPEDEDAQFEMKRFHADTTIAAKLPFMAPVMLWRGFKNYAKYKKYGLIEPPEVKNSTDAYKNKSDIYLEFIQARVWTEPDVDVAKKTFMKLADVNAEFQEWYKENYPSYFAKEKIGKMTVKNELTRRLGVIHDKTKEFYGFGDLSRWWGYKLIQEDDKVAETKLLMDK